MKRSQVTVYDYLALAACFAGLVAIYAQVLPTEKPHGGPERREEEVRSRRGEDH